MYHRVWHQISTTLTSFQFPKQVSKLLIHKPTLVNGFAFQEVVDKTLLDKLATTFHSSTRLRHKETLGEWIKARQEGFNEKSTSKFAQAVIRTRPVCVKENCELVHAVAEFWARVRDHRKHPKFIEATLEHIDDCECQCLCFANRDKVDQADFVKEHFNALSLIMEMSYVDRIIANRTSLHLVYHELISVVNGSKIGAALFLGWVDKALAGYMAHMCSKTYGEHLVRDNALTEKNLANCTATLMEEGKRLKAHDRLMGRREVTIFWGGLELKITFKSLELEFGSRTAAAIKSL